MATRGSAQTLYSRYHNTLNTRNGAIKSGGFDEFMWKLDAAVQPYHEGTVGGDDAIVGGDIEIEITGGLGTPHTIRIYGANEDEIEELPKDSPKSKANQDKVPFDITGAFE